MMNNYYEYNYSFLTKFIINNRNPILIMFFICTLILAYKALFIKPDTRLDRMIPSSHIFIKNSELFRESKPSSSFLRVAVENPNGTVFDFDYLIKLQKLNDEISLLNGVDTAGLKSLWSPNMLWFGITPEGFDSGPVIDNNILADTQESMNIIKNNILNAGIIGSYVSNDFRATMIDFEVFYSSPVTGKHLDTQAFSKNLQHIRQKYQEIGLNIYVIGELQKISDLVDGFEQIVGYFLIAAFITLILLYNYSRCPRATIAPVVCSIAAVICQLGLLNFFDFDLGVYSILVPFLIFAIAVSHSVQVINAFSHEVAKGNSNKDAAKITFHLLHKAGLVALVSDGIGFAMLLVIDIGVIKDLAIVACIGIFVVILANLIILPIVMSYIGVSKNCINHAQYKLEQKTAFWEFLGDFALLSRAKWALGVTVIVAVMGLSYSMDIKIGDLHNGAPELRPDSRYNQDNHFITSSFSTSTDIFNIFVGTPVGQCEKYKVIDLIDRLGWVLQNTEGVQAVDSPATRAKLSRYLGNEGNLKMMSLPRDERVLSRAISNIGLASIAEIGDCSKHIIRVDLVDHKQETLTAVVDAVRQFSTLNDDQNVWFRMGDGSAAYEAATNEVIDHTQYEILVYVYTVVAFMCLIMFRSWKAVICVVIPLFITSILCQVIMVVMDIGVKVATLPVIALGVGIGVDYGIYIFSRLQSYLLMGHSMKQSYHEALKTTGKAVAFTGVTLAVGVATWIFSPIKFQADMGVLLIFMFLWNMLGALTILPALAVMLYGDRKSASVIT